MAGSRVFACVQNLEIVLHLFVPVIYMLDEYSYLALPVVAIVAGNAGGVVNAILVHGRFYMPRISKVEDQWSVDLGFIGNLVVGGVAGLLGYCFTPGNAELKTVIGMGLVCGISGGNFIASVMQKSNLDLSQANAKFFEEQLKRVLPVLSSSRRARGPKKAAPSPAGGGPSTGESHSS
jgi:uncharacterized protein DUF4257